MKGFLYISLSCLIGLVSCTNADSLLQQSEWLRGTWEIQSPEGVYYETWAKKNDSIMLGKSYAVDGKDTQHYESIQLLAKNKSLYYIPTVAGQNNDSAVTFTLKALSEDELVFENVLHDFPTLISYQRISDDSLMAEISGDIDGEFKIIRFPMRKIK